MVVDDRVDLIEMIENPDGKSPSPTRRLERTRVGPCISRIQQPEGSLACVLFRHVTRVM
jgi:hypothetical protein